MIRAAFNVELTWPPDELLMALDGTEKVGWFKMLNTSALS
jgi:hypothetical protein